MGEENFVFDILKRSYVKNRLSHAYLFVGEKGTGKVKTAFDFAKMLYCQSEVKPCNSCVNCLMIESNNNPNVMYIEPDGQNIKKEQIQDLIMEFSKTSLLEGPRIYIINHVDMMSISAANSLLKFIEEPADKETHAILITQNVSSVLPTIISRCQILNFPSSDKKEMKIKLSESGIDKKLINVLPELTNNITDALKMLDERILDMVNLTLSIGSNISSGKSSILLIDEASSLLYERKENMTLLSELLLIYFMDAIHSKCGLEEMVFTDKDSIQKLSLLPRKTLEDILDIIIYTTNVLRFNVNGILAIKDMLLKIEMRLK